MAGPSLSDPSYWPSTAATGIPAPLAYGFGKGVQGMLPRMSAPGLTGVEQGLLGANLGLAQREQGAYDQQQQLSNLLFAQAQGQGPSLAGLQLGAGLDQINRNAMTQAAGASGQGGVLARYQAMQQAAQAGAQTNQAAALARAQEIMGARQQLGQNLGAQAGESGNMYGTNLGAFTNLRNTDTTQQKNENEEKNKVWGGIFQGVSALGAVL